VALLVRAAIVLTARDFRGYHRVQMHVRIAERSCLPLDDPDKGGASYEAARGFLGY